MSNVQLTAIVALALALLGAVFHAGQLSARLAAIEAWRLEMRGDFLQIQGTLRRIEIRLGIRED